MKATRIETETKLTAHDPAVLDRLGDVLAKAGGEVKPGGLRKIHDTYFDTGDWWFFRAGMACRIRRETRTGRKGEQVTLTLKELARPKDRLAIRFELDEELGENAPQSPRKLPGKQLGRQVREMMGDRTLRPLFEIRNERHVFHVNGQGNGEVAEVSGDLVTFHAGGATDSEAEVEIESQGATNDQLRKLADRLVAAMDLDEATTSKFQRGLKLAGLAPPEQPQADDIDMLPGDRTVDVAWRVMARQVELIRWFDPGTRVGLDPEHLHQMRVATRRLRAALRLFAPAVGKAKADGLRRQLGWLADALGAVRDLDVYLLNLPAYAAQLEDQNAEVLTLFRAHLTAQREPHRAALLEALESPRWAELNEALGALISSGAPARTRRRDAVMPIAQFAKRAVKRHMQRVLKLGRALTPDSPDERLHELRLAAKRLRYTCEFVASLVPGPADKLVRRCKQLQDALGDVQDAVVAMGVLGRFADGLSLGPRANGTAAADNGHVSPRVLIDLGRLVEAQQITHDRQRANFFDLWQKFDRGKIRKPLVDALRKAGRKARKGRQKG